MSYEVLDFDRPQNRELVWQAAVAAREKAHAPYSGFRVGELETGDRSVRSSFHAGITML